MQLYDVGWVYENGQNIILVIVPPHVGDWSPEKRQALTADLMQRAEKAGMKGTIVLVWHKVNVLIGHTAPPELASFFQSLTWSGAKQLADQQL